MNIDEDLNRRKKAAELAAQQKAGTAPPEGYGGVDADLDRRKARQQEAIRQREKAAQQQEAERQRAQQERFALHNRLADWGPFQPKPYQVPAQTQEFLAPLEQFKHEKRYQARSFTDRDSVLQGKIAQTAANQAEAAARAGNETEYARYLNAYRKSSGNLEQNAREEEYR